MQTIYGIQTHGTNIIFLSLEEAEEYLIENYPEYCSGKDATYTFCENMIWEDELYISETGNPTPCRDWDYSAYKDGESGDFGLGKTKLEAVMNYFLNYERAA
jgi:hypothetical protein